MQTEKRSRPTKQINTEDDLHRLASVMSEYLESYVLLGYDMDGNAIRICLARNQQSADGLTTLLSNAAMPTGGSNINGDDES